MVVNPRKYTPAARKVKKAIVIQPFIEIPKPPPDFCDQSWLSLSAFLQAVYTLSPINISKEELYRLVNNLCLYEYQEWLYTKLLDSLTSHIAEVISVLDSLVCHVPEFVDKVLMVWHDHNEQLRNIRDVFLFLERVYILPKKGNRNILDLGNSLLKQELDVHITLKERIVSSILELIEQERKFELNNSLFLKDLLTMANSLQFYESYFEVAFIRQTAKFYKEESSQLINQVSVIEFLNYIEKRLGEEADRATRYLLISSTHPLIQTVELVLVVEHSLTIIDKGLTGMLRQGRIEELNLLYKLLFKVNLIPDLKKAFSLYIIKTGKSIVTDKEQQDHMIERLLEFKLKLDDVLHMAFNSNNHLVQASKNAWERFINKDPSKPPLLLANFIDERLKKTSKKRMPEAEVDLLMDQLIEIFRFIESKDIFEAFYCKRLAKRLLYDNSISNDIEHSLITKLKSECGSNFTMRISGMFKDIDLSESLMSSFEMEYRKDIEKSGVDFIVHNLTSPMWPAISQIRVILPPSLTILMDYYTEFYSKNHRGKKLNWQTNMSHCILKARLGTARKELNVSLHQAACLLLFNTAEAISFEDVMKGTGLPKSGAKKELTSLACKKYRILVKTGSPSKVAPSDVFSVNNDFKHRLTRFTINSLHVKEAKEEDDVTREKVITERQYLIDAVIVRIMKTRKRLNHQELLSETFSQLKFPLKNTDVKKRIENLIVRDYLKRDEEDSSLYHYLA
mmetsp:Transcript_28636/g.50915  ORF Transcript_28636/g.50915 Transcript_28636/m.50915 type:complete len:736 (-) Transcript_28636:3689-5896(-)